LNYKVARACICGNIFIWYSEYKILEKHVFVRSTELYRGCTSLAIEHSASGWTNYFISIRTCIPSIPI